MNNTITIGDFIFYCTEPSLCKACIFDIDTNQYVFDGTLNAIPHEYKNTVIQSFDILLDEEDESFLCLNISCDDV